MKTKVITKVFTVSLMVMLSVNAWSQRSSISQDPKYGPDSASRMECASNLSIMNQYVRINTYEYAYDAWLWCFTNCPQSSKNIYIHGAKILKYKIENAGDETAQKEYIDKLMKLYDQRMQYFQQEGRVYGMKGIDLLRYDKTALEEAYGYLEKSVELSDEKVDESVAVTFISTTYALYQQQKKGADVMISNYVKVMDLLAEKQASGDRDPKIPQAIESIEKIFAESGAADCESLVAIFGPKYAEAPEDIELLKKITTLLSQTECEDSELYAQTAESLYNLEPNAESAAKLASLFAVKGEYGKAEEYFNRAISQESSAEKKAKYYLNLAQVKYNQKDYPATRKNCLKALENKSDMGQAYMLIGNAYALSSSTCGSSDFEKQAVYWAAVDKYQKAKSVDPSVTEDANNQIKAYSQRFPDQETTFFNGYTDGQAYKVGCWIQENTTVRTRK